MSKIAQSERTLELMVNCKTYPAISKKHVETVCTGGVDVDGNFVRLYPVPFRLLDSDEQYGRWDTIRVRAYRDTKDTRPESWHLVQGTPIEVLERIKTPKQRWEWMKRTVHASTAAMDAAGTTNGCVEIKPLQLSWGAEKIKWTANQRNVIDQGNFLTTEEQRLEIAERVPWQFRLQFREIASGREDESKVLAWSYYTGFLRERSRAATDEEALEKVADKIRSSIFNPDNTVFAIFGTHSRFRHWMISALYHVPTVIISKDRRQASELF